MSQQEDWEAAVSVGKGGHVDNKDSKAVVFCGIIGSNNVNESLVNAFGNTDLGPMGCQTERILELSEFNGALKHRFIFER